MADSKISQLTSGAPAQAGDEYVIARSGSNFKLTLTNIAASMPPIGATTPNTGAFTSLTNGLGAVGTPSYTFTGDLNTGMWSPTADTVAWSTGGSERMRLDTSGNVGIGNTAANVNDQVGSVRPLLVSTSDSVTTIAGSKANIVIGNADTTTNNTSQLSFAALTGASTTYFAAAAINCVFGARTNAQYPTGQLVFSTSTSLNSAPTEKMRIDSSGNVGIGTASPAFASGDGLEVQRAADATVRVERTGATASAGEFVASSGLVKIGATSGSPFTFITDNTERMRIDSSGNVGIGGTAGGNVKVQLQGSYPVLGGNTNTNGIAISMEVPSAITGGAFVFRSLPSIAASTATTNVYQFGATNVTLGAGASLTNAYGFFADAMTSATNNYGFYSNIASGTNRWNFYAAGTAQNYFAGNVGIGTASPQTRLHTVTSSDGSQAIFSGSQSTNEQTLLFRNAYYTNNSTAGVAAIGWIDTGSSGGILTFKTTTNGGGVSGTPTERMRITDGGEVYIAGTTDQGAYNLQCNGTGVWGAGAYVNGSDERLKNNIQSLDSGLDVIKAIRPVTFQYKPEYSKDQNVQPGFIAQELQTAMAGKPYLDGVVQEGTNHLNVAYQNIIPILVKAIQELEAKVAALEAK